MQRNIRSIFLMAAMMIACCVGCHAVNIRMMTYNVRNGIGMDNHRDYRRVAEVIRKESPDVVAVQELDSLTRRSGGHDVLAEIADLTGMGHVYSSAIDFDGGRYGIGILCKEKPLSVRRVALPGREEERTLVAVEFVDYVFACTHLSLTEADRLGSIGLISDLAESYDKPFFIAGDFNSHPGDEFMSGLLNDFTLMCETEIATFPADNPDERLDYIAVYNRDAAGVSLLGSRVIGEPTASDHRPVVSDIDIIK